MSATRLSAALSDRYRIDRELGQGGMATVYLAQDLRHDRKVALKVLKPELAAVLGADRFVVEIKTTAALQHPHILPLFDSGTAYGFLYYVMPYIQGETLRSKLDRETQLGIEEAVRITRDVADALDYAHRHGVIHRDIKPENILLHDGRPMVADFGIALAVSAAAGGRMTETGMSLGTPHYMSPEQATADKEISARSDVYSLASVLYEMLTGSPPHTGSSAQQIIMKIIAEPVAPVTALRKSVPPHVAAALAKALE
ncbi:MAG TPA: serine/threonine-protein kinase, partial [Gemmatimonadales bacterium]|nr:serine/threonine-protein kinase [Gemmatimonadales bacterium]